ncbi:lipase maturation factor 1 isoform X2 [Ailuropoda melanoleuca]|uniref:lipase maturation factor 1 isoform X2 n=1 Tax=Ailuropoda melanoleuca TaxID=9646 RepID=UPI001494B3F4|nr:lipase maturation factor 1 isoform X2 [Ailuropoda melanoleuca]
MHMRTGGPAMAAPEESLRRRKAGNAGAEPGSPPGTGRDPVGCSARLRAGTFWLTRIVLLRALAFIYFVAFLVAFHQNKQLIGDRGLLPCRTYLKSVQQYFRGPVGWDAVSYAPTVLWLLDWSHMDSNLDALALLGLGVSSFVLVTGCANMVLMATLWVLYMSLVNVGQIWYSFGWESQLLETGFLGIFLCPLWTLSRLPRETPPSQIVLWGFRWLIFRIMLGAGLIKIRGDRCWRDLTCMDFHYETQPVPNPVAYFLHRSPWWVHRFETLSNHFLELVVPFFIFLGRQMCALHGALQILFQVVLIISGNLSFLNWLTMVPSVACFDDATLGFLFPSGPGALKDRVLKLQEETARGARPTLRYGCMVRRAVHVALGVLVAWLSVPVVINLLSPTQVMNTSFNPLRIVNTYGAFGRAPCPGLPTASPRSAQRSSCRAQPAPTPACQTPCGKTMNSSASRVTQGGGHASSPPTTTAWTGSCGSRPSRPTSTMSGSSTWQASSWPTTPQLCPYWPSTLSRTGHLPGGSGESTTGTSSAAPGASTLPRASGGSARRSAPTSPRSASET